LSEKLYKYHSSKITSTHHETLVAMDKWKLTKNTCGKVTYNTLVKVISNICMTVRCRL